MLSALTKSHQSLQQHLMMLPDDQYNIESFREKISREKFCLRGTKPEKSLNLAGKERTKVQSNSQVKKFTSNSDNKKRKQSQQQYALHVASWGTWPTSVGPLIKTNKEAYKAKRAAEKIQKESGLAASTELVLHKESKSKKRKWNKMEMLQSLSYWRV